MINFCSVESQLNSYKISPSKGGDKQHDVNLEMLLRIVHINGTPPLKMRIHAYILHFLAPPPPVSTIFFLYSEAAAATSIAFFSVAASFMVSSKKSSSSSSCFFIADRPAGSSRLLLDLTIIIFISSHCLLHFLLFTLGRPPLRLAFCLLRRWH